MKTNNRQKILMSLILGIAFIISLNCILAVNTMSSPVSQNNYTGTMSIALAIQGNTDNNMTNVTCYYNQTGGATNTWLAQILNTTAGQTSWSTSVALTSLPKTLTYNVSCNIYNGTTLNSTVRASGIGVYTSTPTCSFGTDIDVVEVQDASGVTTSQASTKDSLFSLTYAWKLYDPDNNEQDTSTSSAPNFNDGDFDQIGDFILSLAVTDDNGNQAVCSNKTIIVQGNDQTSDDTIGSVIEEEKSQAQKTNKTVMFVLFSVLGIIVLAVFGYLLLMAVKKQ